ncbi:MAG TPA: hypothetical protein VFR58_16530 [Flavisolibacter sp.]|nr:hypothetical protein [Flavisolibacter sp.]
MKCFQLTLFLLICLAKIYGQTSVRTYHTMVVEITKEKKPKKIFAKVAGVTPFFRPDQDSSWIPDLEKALNQSIPVKIKARAGKYIVKVRFLIERDGSMTDIVCMTDTGFGMCQQVRTAIMKRSSRKWFPQIDSSKTGRYHTPGTSNE